MVRFTKISVLAALGVQSCYGKHTEGGMQYLQSLQSKLEHQKQLHHKNNRQLKMIQHGRMLGGNANIISNYEVDKDCNVIATIDALWNRIEYTYDGNGNLLSVTYPTGGMEHYTYDTQNRLTSTTDPLGNTISYTYDVAGNLASITDALNNMTTFTYDATGNLTSMTNPNNDTTQYQYDAQGRLTLEIDPNGNQSMRYEYDTNNNNLSTTTDAMGGVTRYTYDTNGRILTVTDAADHTTSYIYDGLGRTIISTDALGRTTTLEYNAKAGYLTAVTNDDGVRTEYSYDQLNRLVTITNPGSTTTYSYDSRGRVISETLVMPGGASTTTNYQYDQVGNIIQVQNPNGFTDTYSYDSTGRVVSITDGSNGGLTHYAYDTSGRVASIVAPSGSTTSYTYDAVGNILTSDQAGQVSHYRYDANNNVVSSIDQTGMMTSYFRDVLGRVTEVTSNTTIQYEYDAVGNLIRVVEQGPPQSEVLLEYDVDGNLIRIIRDGTFILGGLLSDYLPNVPEFPSSSNNAPIVPDPERSTIRPYYPNDPLDSWDPTGLKMPEIPVLPYCCKNCGTFGDPHFKTWWNDRYDFHGVCDLVLVHNPDFRDGLGMDIHIRNKKTRQWAYVDAAALRIGDDTLEVRGKRGTSHQYWINGEKGEQIKSNGANILSSNNIHQLSGYSINFNQISDKSYEFVVDLGQDGKIVMITWNAFVRVDFEILKSNNFANSNGMMGRFSDGKKVGRDNVTVLDHNTDMFGQEWQVLSSEPKLFHNIEGPQYPQEKCDIPSMAQLRRRLAVAQSSNIQLDDAYIACASVTSNDRKQDNLDACVFDVMVTGTMDVAGAYLN